MGGSAATLASQYNHRLELGPLAYTAGGSTRSSKQYGWQANGNLDHVQDMIAGTTCEYGYDSLNRVTGAPDVTRGRRIRRPTG